MGSKKNNFCTNFDFLGYRVGLFYKNVKNSS